MPLTPRQQEILGVLRENAAQAPTVAQLCVWLEMRSRGALRRHIRALAQAGLVEPLDRRRPGIRVLPQPLPENLLPLLGRIAAGRPIEAIEEAEPIEVPAELRTAHPCYVLQVVGDSMREAGILNGDHAVIEQRSQARNGEIVVALIRGREATLKRIRQEPGRIVLRAENPDMPPMEYSPEEVEIQGVLIGLMRRYR